MRHVIFDLSLWTVVAMGLLCHLHAQESSARSQGNEPIDPKTTSIVALGGTSEAPGGIVAVPIYFTPGEGVHVGSLSLEVHFVSASLKFDKVRGGIPVEFGDVDVSASVNVDKNEKGVEVSTVSIRFSSPTSPPKDIPRGLLAYIQIQISENGRPATISLQTEAQATELGTNKKLASLRVSEATVEVLKPGVTPGVLACFFFTH